MGILANHVPTVEPLRPGVIEVIESAGEAPKKFFGTLSSHVLFEEANGWPCDIASGGFATVHPNNKLTINVVEAAPLEDFSIEVRSSLSPSTCSRTLVWTLY
jgi:F-type H+-transporting ATPase subunit delta